MTTTKSRNGLLPSATLQQRKKKQQNMSTSFDVSSPATHKSKKLKKTMRSHHSTSSSSSTVVRSCTEFSHERSMYSANGGSSASVFSKLLIQPAPYVKNQSISYRPPTSTLAGRNPGVTLLHASDHISVLPVRTIPAGKLKQLIASPMLSNYHRDHSSSTTSNNNISNHHNNHNNHTQQPQTADTSSTLSTHSPVSFSSPQSASSPNQQMQQQQHGRPLRIAQPPPLSSSSSNGSAAFPSMAPSHSTTSFPSASVGHRAAPHLHSSISVPTMHHHQKYQQTGTGSNGRPLGWSVVSHSALGERFGQMSYEQLLELARNQQRQIETNVVELDERQRDAALFSVAKHTASSESEQQQNANMLMATIRAQIERDERELAQLGQCQEEARQLREHNQNEGRQLRQLEAEYQNGETQLRRTVQMVDSLRSQLEVLYQRRAAAADAAIARQRQINGVGKPLGERRPKASISPFKKSESSADRDETDSFSKPMPSSMAEDQAQPEASTSSTVAAGVVHWRTEAPPHHEHQPMPAHQYEQYQSGCLLPPAVDKISLRRNSLNQAKRNSLVSEFGASGEDHILAMLLAEQRRGRSHISFGRSWDGQLEAGLGGDGERGSIVANAKASLGLLESMNRAAEQKEQQQKAAAADLARTRRAMTSKVSPTKEPTLMRSRINDEEDQMKKKAEEEKTKGGRQIHEQEQQQPQSTASAVRQKAAKFQAAFVAPPVTTQNSSQMLPQKQSKQTQQTLPQHQTHLVVQLPPKTPSPVKRAALPSAESLDAFNENFTKLAPTCEAEEEFDKQEEDEKKKSPAKEEVKVKVEWEVPSEEEKNHQPTEEDWKRAEELERKEEEANGQKDDEEEEEEESVEDVEEKEEVEVMLLAKIDLNANNGQNWAPKVDEEGATSCEATAPSQLPPHSPPEADSPTLSATDSSSTVESEKSHSLECLLDGSWQPQPSGSGQLAGTKGILRRKQIAQENSGRKKRVNFDVVVLFLDVAYEGHYETFVELASKIPDISVANSEGITALHYAICAGSQDIVRFLVDHGADVNALDVDGWSPLHCAASCDNLPMLRMLVENGACPLATTISKSETAAQIFDECSDYAAGVEYMNFLEHCMGQVNDGKVYAAYSYEAQHEDELNFEEGDELKVLKKSEKPAEEEEEEEKKTQENGHETEEDEDGQHEQQTKVAAHQLWWLCEHTQREGQRGLVPRNYLAIFPSWKHRDRYQLNFQLPHQLNNGDGDGTSSVDSPAADENSPAAEESGASRKMAGNAVISVQHNGKPLGHQELSTYA